MVTIRTKDLHKILSIICCIGMIVGLLGGLEKGKVISQAASYPSDYRYWCQGASDDANMRNYGCWVTAQAKLLYETGVDRSSGFNPDSYLNWQRANGLINSGFYQTNGGNAPSIYASQKGKTLTYMGNWQATADQLWFNINAGYYTIVQVPGHYVMLANQLSKEKGVLYCYDSWSDRSSVAPQPLSRYSAWNSGYVYRYDSKDTTPPTISDVKVTNVTANGYTVTCTATDNVGVTKVEFPTWRVSDTSEGCNWYAGTRNGNTWSFTYTGAVFEDKYLTHIYAYDAEGNKTAVSAGEVFCKRQESVYSIVDGGIYEIESFLNNIKVMDVDCGSSKEGANIHLYTRNDTNAQRFKIISVGNGYYKMIAMCSGMAVDVYGAQRTNGINVGQYAYNGTDAQLFRFVNAGNGYCYIISKLGSFIDLKGGSTSDGTNIQTWGFGAKENQSWKLNLKEVPSTSTPVPATPTVTPEVTPMPEVTSTPSPQVTPMPEVTSTPSPQVTPMPEVTSTPMEIPLPTKIPNHSSSVLGPIPNSTSTSQRTYKTTDDNHANNSEEKPSKVTGLKLKNVKGKRVKVSWKRNQNIVGSYQIQYAQNKSFTKARKTIYCSGSYRNNVISGLKKGKTYYIRIRAYRLSALLRENGTWKKIYGEWSPAKKIKIRK